MNGLGNCKASCRLTDTSERVYVVVALEVANAFNSARWKKIEEALCSKRVPWKSSVTTYATEQSHLVKRTSNRNMWGSKGVGSRATLIESDVRRSLQGEFRRNHKAFIVNTCALCV
ncbi:Hypothetical protein CINCED_3A010868 [Cinara cedri]|uniref:Reverse transcriptase domain n=1 Tax=Cinara cedri TaxID=506608 RepID=A0A5E4NL40_9HEMI|nr:Hypothetical protein CINCED_3A010868 [Cinara cedri]